MNRLDIVNFSEEKKGSFLGKVAKSAAVALGAAGAAYGAYKLGQHFAPQIGEGVGNLAGKLSENNTINKLASSSSETLSKIVPDSIKETAAKGAVKGGLAATPNALLEGAKSAKTAAKNSDFVTGMKGVFDWATKPGRDLVNAGKSAAGSLFKATKSAASGTINKVASSQPVQAVKKVMNSAPVQIVKDTTVGTFKELGNKTAEVTKGITNVAIDAGKAAKDAISSGATTAKSIIKTGEVQGAGKELGKKYAPHLMAGAAGLGGAYLAHKALEDDD